MMPGYCFLPSPSYVTTALGTILGTPRNTSFTGLWTRPIFRLGLISDLPGERNGNFHSSLDSSHLHIPVRAKMKGRTMVVEQNSNSLSGTYIYSSIAKIPPHPTPYAELLLNKVSSLKGITGVPIVPTCTWGWSWQWHFQFLAGLIGPSSLIRDM